MKIEIVCSYLLLTSENTMRQSQLFTKTRKEAPKDEVSKNAQLLIRAGYVYKEMAGVYVYLPLGLRVLNKVIAIIRDEMNGIGGQEIVLSALQQKETWEPTNQWSDKEVDVWFKTELKNGTELGLAVTHEAALTKMMKDFISSYRHLPSYAYQFQTKFRNETRAKSGIMRCREFIMKDLYSFSKDQAEHDMFYEKAKQAYVRIFKRIGLGDQTYVTFASGGMFSKFSHEFQTVTDAGEDVIYVSEKKGIAINKEVLTPELLIELGIDKEDLIEKKAVEVGNIFNLATRFSSALDLTYVNESGEKVPVVMGSYGIGPGRVMGAVVECLSDEKGIVWPESIAPFQVHLISLGKEGSVATKKAEELYKTFTDTGVEVLFDDRDVRPGEKFADSDLIGIPMRLVISDKTCAEGKVEVKYRKTGEVLFIEDSKILSVIKK
jgi:prolyl-tRNA synthetase